MYTLSFDKAASEIGDLVNWLTHQVGASPKLQEGYANPMIQRAVNILLADENVLSRGDFVSTILRMPDMWRNALMEYVQQVPPYERTGLTIKSTVKNVGNTTCRVVRAVRQIPVRNLGSGEVSDAWRTHATYANLSPGEEITLPPDMAVHALYKYGRYGKPVFLWDMLDGDRASLPLVEVAYSAEYLEIGDDGQDQVPAEIDSKKWREERIAEYRDQLKSAKSKSEKQRILSGIPSHWGVGDERDAA